MNKIIYLTYKDNNIPNKIIHNIKNLNPNYTIKFYTNNDCSKFLLEEYSQLYLDIFNFLKDGPIKADFWRICILYKYGGIYIDIDIEFIMSLDDFIEPDVEFLTCLTNDENYKNKSAWKAHGMVYGDRWNPHIIASKPNNILLKRCIDEYVNRYNKLSYNYWDYSLVNIFAIKLDDLYNIIDNHREGIYYYNNKKVQFIKESIPKESIPKDSKRQDCFYKNKIVLYNRYRDYINHKFKTIYINKTIYLTYKHNNIPDKVFNNWKRLNPEYKIDFSLDDDCISFLKTNFNTDIVRIFKKLHRGAWKADLWRLCKLYINSGIYSDVDIEPFLELNTLDTDVTFYSCIAEDSISIFQAFIVNFSKPKNKLLLACLIYFLQYKDSSNFNWPTNNMYNLLKYNINKRNIQPYIKYDLYIIKIPIYFGSSNTNTKIIQLYYFPEDIEYTINLYNTIHPDDFNFNIKDNKLIITRIDKDEGWGYNHSCDICIKSKEVIYLFQEYITTRHKYKDNWANPYDAYVSNEKQEKILNSHYSDYPW